MEYTSTTAKNDEANVNMSDDVTSQIRHLFTPKLDLKVQLYDHYSNKGNFALTDFTNV